MNEALKGVAAATTTWLLRAFPPSAGALSGARAEAQVRQAVTVALWLRYPTPWDAGLLSLTGPGGSARLDELHGFPPAAAPGSPSAGTAEEPWRTWVDETVASWALCLLADAGLATAAVRQAARTAHAGAVAPDFRQLTAPEEHAARSAALARHPDLTDRAAALHRPALLALITPDPQPVV